MIVFVFFVLLLCLAPLCAETAEEPRIVGGRELGRSKYPYVVAYYVRRYGALEFQCGGSILTIHYVLSAAHCVDNMEGQGAIRAGSLHRDRGGELIPISQTFVHPKYNSTFVSNDYALFKLKTPLRLGRNVRRIRLPPPNLIIPDGSKVFVTGWGQTSEGGSISKRLLGVPLKKIGVMECKKVYANLTSKITDMNICAQGAPGKDSCGGDSGGGLIYNSMIVGVVSFGVGCARPGVPGVYADTLKVLKWINDTIEK